MIYVKLIRQEGSKSTHELLQLEPYTTCGTYDKITSDELFRIPVNTAVPVTMTVWLEGADPDCINAIMGNLINAQIRFISTDMS